MLAEPSSSRLSFIPYVAEPEGLTAQVYERPNLNASVTVEPAHEQAYLQSATSHGLPEISSADDLVSPLQRKAESEWTTGKGVDPFTAVQEEDGNRV